MTGRIVDIKRLAVHDGPGIRTTLFLKGCSLACRWCHNPESISSKPEIGWIARKCVGCGECVRVCSRGVHVVENGKHGIHREGCVGCGRCADACLADAIEYYGRDITVEQAVAAILEDKTFYNVSGGGCTISGGEPLLQAEFCAAVFRALKSQGVHCAIDTSGAATWSAFESVLPWTDLFLYDVKHVDDHVHREQTGGSNKTILGNLGRLSKCGVPIEIRIPVIPEVNADEDSVAAIGRFLSGIRNIAAVKLLPYHDFARSKYEAIGRRDSMPHVSTPGPEQMAKCATILEQYGLRVRM